MWRVKRINDILRDYDSRLYAKTNENGVIQVFRKCVDYERYQDQDFDFTYSRYNPYFVLALTDTWNMRGKPVDWGLGPIERKIREMDLHHRDSLAQELLASYERSEESSKRNLRNNLEASLKEARRPFQKLVNDINTSTLDKTITSRRNEDGYRK